MELLELPEPLKPFQKLPHQNTDITTYFHLNRFKNSGPNRIKNEAKDLLQTDNIDLGKFTTGYKNKNQNFKVLSIANHTGTLKSGHYTTVATTGWNKQDLSER